MERTTKPEGPSSDKRTHSNFVDVSSCCSPGEATEYCIQGSQNQYSTQDASCSNSDYKFHEIILQL